MAKGQKVLIADTETDFVEWATRQLEQGEVKVFSAGRADEALALFIKEKPDLTIVDTHIQPFPGMELLSRIRDRDSNAFVLLISQFGTTQAVIEAMKLGAFDFVRKEALAFNFRVIVETALRERAQMRAATASAPKLTVEQNQDSIVGQSPAMQQVFKLVGRVAGSDAPVMITGESGTGKELVARAIHHHSHRSTKPYVAINCAAIPEQLLESELFGHEKGAFTGATGQRIGRFEQCDGGTLFLDEIGDMPLPLQGKILRVLQDGEIIRVGGNQSVKTDVRIIAATNRNLEVEVGEKRFREDLFYRLNVVRIQLPPLRQRVDDIRLLAEYFVQRVATEKRLPKLKLSEEAVRVLEAHTWPGNVRELENTIQRACVLSTSDILMPKDIPLGQVAADRRESSAATTKEEAIAILLRAAQADSSIELLPWLEREFTVHAMRETGGNQVRAAKLLGITRATLRKRLERFGVTRELVIE